jgi:hypothetical protein
MNLHSFVPRPLDTIRPGDALDHVVAIHDRCVFRVNEARREEAVECSSVALYQSCRPLVFEL